MAESTAVDRVRPYTKSTPARLEAMRYCLEVVDTVGVRGDVVECGVWRGGNIMLARILSPARACWLYDTFDGMTRPDPVLDVKRSGHRAIDRYEEKITNGTKWDAVGISEVVENFTAMGLMDSCQFIVGPVEETLADGGEKPETICLLRLDVDWYSPTRVALRALYPRLSKGGFLIVDDYGHWMGCRKAVDEFFGVHPPLHRDVDYTCRVFRKQ